MTYKDKEVYLEHSRGMDPQIHLSVTFRGGTQSFLVSDSSNTTWADVEAMVKVSFDLNDIQIKYLDEDNDEVSVNTAEEYDEALKIAAKQGNQLQMNVYDISASPVWSLWQTLEKSEKLPILKDGGKPLSCDSMLARPLGQDGDSERDREKTEREQPPAEGPPEWFTSYLEKFREQVVQETVESLEQKLSQQLFLSNQPSGSLSSSTRRSPPTQSNPFDWLLSCSNCQAPIVGIRYQCSVCPSYSICELCEAGMYAHDPDHVLLKLRKPILCISETCNLSPRLATLEQVRLQKQMDKRFLKAEKQRLRAEKKQRKAEVRELKKQLKLHRKIHLWNSVHALDNVSLAAAKSESLQPSVLLPLQGCPPVIVPTLGAVFVDENLPDGTHLQPMTNFIKHWRMRNTGNMEWSSDTKLQLMWGNLTVVSSEKKDVMVPFLLPGQVGKVSVAFLAPPLEGTYASHWRLSHRGEQFGPRIWCSIVVEATSSSTDSPEDGKWMCTSGQKDGPPCVKEESSPKPQAEALQATDATTQGGLASPHAPALAKKTVAREREFYIPSVDLLTAQDLLSFELLDINIVQELEQVPANAPGDTQVDKGKAENPANQEEGEEDMSGTQFVCETVIRSLTLDAAPDHRPPQKKKSSLHRSLQGIQDSTHCNPKSENAVKTKSNPVSTLQEPELSNQSPEIAIEPEFDNLMVPRGGREPSDGETEDDAKDDVRSQASSASSEDYIIILPECFDTSRPLGESLYSSALSQPLASPGGESHPVKDLLITSQILDAVPLTPQIMALQPARSPALAESHIPPEMSSPGREETPLSVPDQRREEPRGVNVSELPSAGIVNNIPACSEFSRYSQGNSIAGGLVKGALSVAASAYKALFVGPTCTEQALPVTSEEQMAAFLANLNEMGFCDRQLNLRLLRRHNCDMGHVVTELLQLSHNDWYGSQY